MDTERTAETSGSSPGGGAGFATPPRPLRAALIAGLLASAAGLTTGTSKAPAPATPPPANTTQGAAGAGAPSPGAAPPAAKPPAGKGGSPGTAVPPAAVAAGAGVPRIAPVRHELPDGLFHGYLYSAPGARACSAHPPTGAYRRCAVDRGRLLGCGGGAFRSSTTVYCQGGVYRTCRVDATGHLGRCGAAFSGWTVTEKRGALRRCCIHGGRLKYCTNAADYVCTAADRRRRAAPLPAASPPPVESPPPVRVAPQPLRRPAPRRGSWQRCDLFNGRVSFCRGWYHGQAVVFHDGAYRSCRIFNGQISHCGSWFQGEAVAHQNGAWRLCRIFNGRISHCGTWYKGQAAVYREQ